MKGFSGVFNMKDLKNDTSRIARDACSSDEPILIMRNNRPYVVIMSAEDYDQSLVNSSVDITEVEK